jgi:tetrahydromethanopterin S-methyltransferase subunit B
MSEDRLTRDDLVLLMESYRNMITMHQTILDQSEKTIEKMDNIANKQDSLFSKQSSICNTLNKVSANLDDTTRSLADAGKAATAHEKESLQQYSKLINKIHLGWVGMGTIIMGLIGLIIILFDLYKNVTV